jgi:hypothetical protein
MKKEIKIWIAAFVMIGAILIFASGCKKNNGNPVNPGSQSNEGIIIKGHIPKAGLMKSESVKSGESLSLADAKKIIIFSKYYYSLTDIVADSFSVNGRIGTGVSLIFLDANNHYIGNLSPDGLNMLPLGNLTNGENTKIDLSDLSLVGHSVIPSHDPLGNEIIISQTEINSLKALDGYYESIAKNIDADNDSIPDVLSNKQLVVFNMFGVNGGHWGYNDSLPVPEDSAHYYVNYEIEINGGSALTFSNGNITLSGPAGNPYPMITTWGYMMAPQCGGNRGFISSFGVLDRAPMDAPWGTAFLPFRKGTYTLTIDGNQKFTLDYSNIDVKNDLVIIAPTLHTNSAGKLTSITLEYKLPDGTVINPASMLTNVMIQLTDNRANQFFNSQMLTASTGFSAITPDSVLDISALHGMDIWYDDLLGNQYDIMWH